MNAPAPLPRADSDTPSPKTTPGRGIDPLNSLQRHRHVAMAVGLVVLVVGLPAAWVLGAAKYYTEAAIRISPVFVRNLEEDDELKIPSYTQFRQFVKQQTATINRYDIVLQALQRMGDKRVLFQNPGEEDRRAAERLMASLVVRAIPDTYLITVGLNGDARHRDGITETVNAVANEYVSRTMSEELYASDARIERLKEHSAALATELQEKVTRLSALALQLGVSSFDPNTLNPFDRMLIDIRAALADARRTRIVADAKLAAVETAQERDAVLEIDSAAQAQLLADLGVNAAKRPLYERRDKVLSEISGLTPDHVGYKVGEQQLKEIDAELARISTTALAAIKEQLRARRKTQAAEEWSRAKAEADQAHATEAALAADLQAREAQLGAYTTAYHEGLDLTRAIATARDHEKAITDRLNFLTLESRAPGFARVVSPARTPDIPIKGGRKKLFLLVCALSVMVALAVPLGLDLADPRVLVPADLEKALGFPPMAWVAQRSDARTTAFANDQIRRLALRLAREHQAHGTKVLAVTGVKPRAGATTFAIELARELDVAGVHALAVDLNAADPDPRFRNGTRALGLAAALTGAVPAADVIVPRSNGLPDRIPFGDAVGVLPTGNGTLRVLLRELSDAYDLVLLDVPPLSLSAEAEAIVAAADGALLVVPAEAVWPADVQRVARIVERLAPAVVGVALNGVRIYARGATYTALLREYETGERAPPTALVNRLWT